MPARCQPLHLRLLDVGTAQLRTESAQFGTRLKVLRKRGAAAAPFAGVPRAGSPVDPAGNVLAGFLVFGRVIQSTSHAGYLDLERLVKLVDDTEI